MNVVDGDVEGGHDFVSRGFESGPCGVCLCLLLASVGPILFFFFVVLFFVLDCFPNETSFTGRSPDQLLGFFVIAVVVLLYFELASGCVTVSPGRGRQRD